MKISLSEFEPNFSLRGGSDQISSCSGMFDALTKGMASLGLVDEPEAVVRSTASPSPHRAFGIATDPNLGRPHRVHRT